MNASLNKLSPKLKNTSSGFTLIELMVTIAVLAIIVGIAAPNISTQLANQRVKSTAATLANALKEAKVESVIRRQPMELNVDTDTHTLIIESDNSVEIASYGYSGNSNIKTDESTTTVIFRPSKRANEITYTICDDKNSSTAIQVFVNEVASISTAIGGTC
ncbi:pilus assembly FimT family protein [Psychrobacter sp. AOP7-A1-24]|uniref:pilus assembly FimT family protein n=1 Tax=Psychrobacter sp. AOP7-A1-24 TaxID=3457646 RepID=UPI00402BC525